MKGKAAVVYMGRKGGGNLYTLLIARAVRESGIEMKLFLSNSMDNLHEFGAEGLQIETFDTFRGGFLDKFMFPFRAWKIASAIKRYDPDVVYHTMFNPYITAIEFLLPGKKHVYTFHNYTAVKRPMDHIIDFFQDLSMRLATHVVVLSRYFEEMVNRKFPGKETFLIPLPTFRYQGDKAKLAYGKEFGKYLLFAGRMTERYKGLEVMEKAFEIIREKEPDIKLVVAGRGAEKKESDGEGIVRLGRWLSDREFNGLVLNSFLVVVPYVQPNPSAVAATATALGVPVAASDLPCLNEQVFEGRNGVLFRAGDAKALAETVLWLATDDKRYRKVKDGVEEVAEELDIESLQPLVAGMLKKLSCVKDDGVAT